MRNDRENLVVKLTFLFALKIVRYTQLLEEKKKYIIARQLLKAGTSVGANVREAQNAESKADFIHKMKIAAKEADETGYWLLLCDNIKEFPDCKELLAECGAIIKVISKIVGSAKRNQGF